MKFYQGSIPFFCTVKISQREGRGPSTRVKIKEIVTLHYTTLHDATRKKKRRVFEIFVVIFKRLKFFSSFIYYL